MLRRSKKAIYANITYEERRYISSVLIIIDKVFQMHYYKLFDSLYLNNAEVAIYQIANQCYISRNKAFHDIDVMNQLIKITLEVYHKYHLGINLF